jgi:hypothetical protein
MITIIESRRNFWVIDDQLRCYDNYNKDDYDLDGLPDDAPREPYLEWWIIPDPHTSTIRTMRDDPTFALDDDRGAWFETALIKAAQFTTNQYPILTIVCTHNIHVGQNATIINQHNS